MINDKMPNYELIAVNKLIIVLVAIVTFYVLSCCSNLVGLDFCLYNSKIEAKPKNYI